MGNTLAHNLFQTIQVEESICYPNMFSSIVSFYLKNIWTRQICITLSRRIFVGLTDFFFKFTFIKLKKIASGWQIYFSDDCIMRMDKCFMKIFIRKLIAGALFFK